MKEEQKQIEKEKAPAPAGPIRKFFRSVRDRLGMSDKRFRKTYTVTFGIYHDGQHVSSFPMKVKANNREHAWKILSTHVEIKPIKLTLD